MINEYTAKDAAIQSVRIMIDEMQFLKELPASDLVAELQRRNYKNFATHATDSEIEDEHSERELGDGDVNTSSDDELFQELERRGCYIFGEDRVEKVGNLIDKINQKRATIDEIYSMLEDITGRLICR